MTILQDAHGPLHIRPMQEVDLEQVHAIDQMSFSLPWPASSFRYELFENPNSLLWVAEIEVQGGQRQVVGAIVIWLVVDEAHIASIAVHPDYRTRCIGSRLLVTALEETIRKGCRSATLEVRAGNLISQDFYRRFRFEVVGRRPRYYRDNNEDALLMTLDGLGLDYFKWLESGEWQKRAPVNVMRQAK